jgi:hypothetical protein
VDGNKRRGRSAGDGMQRLLMDFGRQRFWWAMLGRVC